MRFRDSHPANKRKSDIIVGSGLAGAASAATLAEQGYQVKCFCYQDSPRRAHLIAAQGGINAAKNYQNNGDSVYRLFYDTIKGGDFRAREANVHRLAEVGSQIIDQCVSQGVPFAREYGGLLDNRSFGGAQVSRTFYARGQTGQQLLLGTYAALSHQIAVGKHVIEERYDNLFEMYHNITGEDAYERPMRIYPAVHYTMGGLWDDYNLMSNIPGLHVLGEANFSDHGANRLGASALMQGLADGYFVIPHTLGTYMATQFGQKVDANAPAFRQAVDAVKARVQKLISIKGSRSANSFHRVLGKILWDKCGMARDQPGHEEALRKIAGLREEFWTNLKLLGSADGINMELARAGRVADFLGFGELMCLDALSRNPYSPALRIALQPFMRAIPSKQFTGNQSLHKQRKHKVCPSSRLSSPRATGPRPRWVPSIT